MDSPTGSSAGVYSIGAVARMLDVPAQTLRAWEERYGQIVPDRSPGGQRLYSRDHVDRLRFVIEQIDSGLQPADAHRLLAERRDAPPIERSDEPTVSSATPAGGERSVAEGGRLSILIAERDPYAAEFSDYFLRTEGYTSRVALDVAEAERMLTDQASNLVVIDLMISGGAGLALCSSVRALGSTPILAVSAVGSGDAALEAGADAFLQKPLDPLRFLSAVRDLLGTSAYLRRGEQGR